MSAKEILLYGAVGNWGLTALDVMYQLEQMKDAPEISVRIHSPGGDAIEGIAICNALRRHPGKKTVHIDGEASSAASLIAMAGDKIKMAENAIMMLHDPWCGVMGDADTMRGAAEMLDAIASAYVAGYKAKTGKGEDEIRALMKKHAFPGGAYLTAAAAVAAGLADEIGAPVAAKALARASVLDLSRAPAAVAQLYPAATHLPGMTDVKADTQSTKHLALAKGLGKKCSALAGHAQKCAESDHPGLKALGAGLAESMAQHVAAVKAAFPDMEPDGDEGEGESEEKKAAAGLIALCETLTGKSGAELRPALVLLSEQARANAAGTVASQDTQRRELLDSLIRPVSEGGQGKIRPSSRAVFEDFTLAELQAFAKSAPAVGPKPAAEVQPAAVLDGKPPALGEDAKADDGLALLGIDPKSAWAQPGQGLGSARRTP